MVGSQLDPLGTACSTNAVPLQEMLWQWPSQRIVNAARQGLVVLWT
jgi:hypothetical protein